MRFACKFFLRWQIAKPDMASILMSSARCFFLDKIREKLRGPAPSDSMEVDESQDPAGDVDTVVNDCKFSMKLHMADSARKQVKSGAQR